jgi:hypothetical protein
MTELAIDKLAAQLKTDIAEQAAIFALAIDHKKIDPSKIESQIDVCIMIAEEAIKFCQHHDDAREKLCERARENYWDSNDWYVTSDEYFEEHIAEKLYKD